jgi:hypothetical protein
MSHGHLPRQTAAEPHVSVNAGEFLASSRPQLAQRMRTVMRQQSADAEQAAAKMARLAENNWQLRKQVGELLRDANFLGILSDSGVEQLPRMLVSRIAYATHDGEPFRRLDIASPVLQSRCARAPGLPVPGRLPDRTVASLARMNSFRQGKVLALMQRTGCFTGDFAIALLAATPARELADGESVIHRNSRFAANLTRYERRLEVALRVIEVLAPDYPLMLVERTLQVAFGRHLLAIGPARDWLRQRAPLSLEVLQDAGVAAEPARRPRRHIRVAQ